MKLGIRLSDKRLRYGVGVRLPKWIENLVVLIWNRTACFFLGHTYLCRQRPDELPVCADCTARVKKFEESEVIDEW